jgi:hypothetical protein
VAFVHNRASGRACQETSDAECDNMSRSAIGMKLVDIVRLAAEMPAKFVSSGILSFSAHREADALT